MMYLTRAVLNKAAGVASLAPLLDPHDPNRALDAHHRLIWTLFPDRDATRDFLWRADGQGRFYVLSHRRPVQCELFLPLNSTEFAPAIAPGDRLLVHIARQCHQGSARRTGSARSLSQPSRGPCHGRLVLHSRAGRTQPRSHASERPAMRMQIADRVANSIG